jgi:LSD1 subclass zinc finger protein
MMVDPDLLAILACPSCRAPLAEDEGASELVCSGAGCGLAYPVRDGIPVLLVAEARRPLAEGDEPPAADPLADV